MRKPKTEIGISLAFICLVLLGVMPIISNSRPEHSDALGFAFSLSLWQLLFALPLFLHESCSSDKGIFAISIGHRLFRRVAMVNLVTGIMFGLATWCYVLSMERAGAINAAIAIQAYPLFAILMEMLLLRKLKSRRELTVTVILLTALYFLGTHGTWRLSGLTPWFWLALCVPLLWSIAHVLIREELTHSPITPAQITFFRVLLATIFLGAILLLAGKPDLISLFTRELLPNAILMGFFYYLELLVWFHAMRHIDVSLASSITTPWPAVTMLLAAIFLGDEIEGYQVVTFMIVAVCLYFLLVANSKPPFTKRFFSKLHQSE